VTFTGKHSSFELSTKIYYSKSFALNLLVPREGGKTTKIKEKNDKFMLSANQKGQNRKYKYNSKGHVVPEKVYLQYIIIGYIYSSEFS
jgi:hypothetical protein